jgi:DNA adenine methylase
MGYPGGKAGDGVYQRLINLMPPHEVYIEPFLGGGALMRFKRPARLNIGLDLDPAVIEQTQGCCAGSLDPAIGTSSPETALWDPLAPNDGDGPVFKFDCTDGIQFLKRYQFTGRELVYCDPPYLMSTRPLAARPCYRFEMSDVDHRRFLRVAIALPCAVMISGYHSGLYEDALKGWSSIHFQAKTRGRMATEWVWFNFPRPAVLHDYRFLGENWRERERIKRKKERWTARLRRMPEAERQALLSALLELDSPELSRSCPRLPSGTPISGKISSPDLAIPPASRKLLDGGNPAAAQTEGRNGA